MRYHRSKLLLGIALAGLVGLGGSAEAQMGPGMGGPMGPGMGGAQQPAGSEKKEGVAEAAPKTPGLLPTTPALPPPRGRRKKWKLLEMGGYFRVRGDWMKNFNLGFNDDPTLGGAPFPRSLSCTATTSPHPSCNDTLSSTNMRLRLEPVLNIDEGTSVHVQADVFDNQVFGATPVGRDLSGTYNGMPTASSTGKPPLGAFGNTQVAPEQGINGDRPPILVKRAWAEVAVPLGILKFGRQPNHWGMGVYYNAGGYDPINGTYDYDADYGDSVDRISFSAQIPGTGLRAMVASDWAYTGLASNQTSANRGQEGRPFALDQGVDATAWVGVISKMDSPQEWRDTIDRGENAYNYGVYFEYKNQDWDENLTGFTQGGTFDSVNNYVQRKYKTYTTSLWGKLGMGKHQLEAEFVSILGSVNRLSDLTGNTNNVDIYKFGGVARYHWRGVDDKLKLGLETGFATGDQYDNLPQGSTNIEFANTLGGPSTTRLTAFFFNREYHVDFLMWRRLYGALTNAAYAKPFLSYDLTKGITFTIANITSLALKPISTPGNQTLYGTEFDGQLSYHTDRLWAGISYGVLFPFGALSHPTDNLDQGGPGFGYGTDAQGVANTGDPGTAHYVQLRLVLVF